MATATKETATAARIHVQVWVGTNSARVTEMDGAYRPGARLRVLRLQGHHGQDRTLGDIALNLRLCAEELDRSVGFDQAERTLRARFAELTTSFGHADGTVDVLRAEHLAPALEGAIRGVDAPRDPLVFNCPRWGIKADEDGISMHDDDRNNEGRMITTRQSPARAYEIARRVWARLVLAGSMHEASEILCAEGARLHYYCGTD